MSRSRVSPAHADDSTADEEAPVHPQTPEPDSEITAAGSEPPQPGSRATQRRGSAAGARRGSLFDELARRASLAAEQRDEDSTPDGPGGHYDSTLLEDLDEMGRRLSQAVPPQPEARGAKSALGRKFAGLIERLMNDDELDLASTQACVREWMQENVSRLALEEKVKLYEVRERARATRARRAISPRGASARVHSSLLPAPRSSSRT